MTADRQVDNFKIQERLLGNSLEKNDQPTPFHNELYPGALNHAYLRISGGATVDLPPGFPKADLLLGKAESAFNMNGSPSGPESVLIARLSQSENEVSRATAGRTANANDAKHGEVELHSSKHVPKETHEKKLTHFVGTTEYFNDPKDYLAARSKWAKDRHNQVPQVSEEFWGFAYDLNLPDKKGNHWHPLPPDGYETPLESSWEQSREETDKYNRAHPKQIYWSDLTPKQWDEFNSGRR